MADVQLILNAGSSSLKFSIFLVEGGPKLLFHGKVESLQNGPHFVAKDASGTVVGERSWPAETHVDYPAAIEFLFGWCRDHLGGNTIVEAGHRVVHGGMAFGGPVRIDDAVLQALDDLIPLAPLHQPHNLEAIRAIAAHVPDLPQVACFDTAFHRTQPPVAQRFALPRWLTDEGVKRYGFHGLAYESVASALADLDPAAASGRTIAAHLGNGASLCALLGGRSVATTMSFTPLDGLPMGTRVGSLDPAVILYLTRKHGMDAAQLEDLLYHQSGLLGVSGISGDMRELLASRDPHAAEAIDLFVYRIGREIGSMAATLGGLDALVFSGGIGENSAEIRQRVCHAASWLGVAIDETANAKGVGKIHREGSSVTAWVVAVDEELVIARKTREVLGREAHPGRSVKDA